MACNRESADQCQQDSMPGTRVHAVAERWANLLHRDQQRVEMPDMEPDELMERFAEQAISPEILEGSGSVFAIARDLMHMMDGDVRLGIDGAPV